MQNCTPNFYTYNGDMHWLTHRKQEKNLNSW